MKNVINMQVAFAAMALAATGTDMSYVKQGDGPYLWSDTSAWYDTAGETALGALPGTGDAVFLYGDYTADNPLVLNSSVSIAGFEMGCKGYGTKNDVFRLDITTGGTLSTGGSCTNVWGYGSCTSVVTVAEGAAFSSSVVADHIGRIDGAVVVVTNRGDMSFKSFMLGYANASHAVFENYGTLSVSDSFTIGRGVTTSAGSGTLRIRPGSVFTKVLKKVGSGYNFCMIGAQATGALIIEEKVFFPSGDRLLVGTSKGGVGTLEVAGDGCVTNLSGELSIDLGGATDSTGRLITSGNASVMLRKSGILCIQGADGSNSTCQVTMSGNSSVTTKNSGARFGSGNDSSVMLDLSGNASLQLASDSSIGTGTCASVAATLSGNAGISAGTMLIGGPDSQIGMSLSDSAYIMPSQKFHFMAEPYVTGTGVVALTGGRLMLRPRTSAEYNPFYLGTNGANAAVRGYGSFVSHTTTIQDLATGRRVRTVLRGRFEADGFGSNSDLDATVLTICNDVNEANANGDSGWYAQNGGRVFFPHGDAVSGGAVTIGDNAARETPELVNSFRVQLTGATDGYYLHSALYAADRKDLPGALPMAEGDIALGVWRMGYASGGQFTSAPSKAKTFTSADVTIRYGTSTLKLGRKYRVRALRWNGSAWVETTSFLATKSSSNGLVTFTGLDPYSDDSCYNIGWTALVAQKIGHFAISFR